jgi:glycine/sarcosine N-methyltransferase
MPLRCIRKPCIQGKKKMGQDLYSGFADRYDLFFDGSDDRVRTEFFRRLYLQNKTRSILDCACGTGRELLMFHSLGLEVCGSDISESMIIQARLNLVQNAVTIPVLKVDYRELPQYFNTHFDAVACLSSAIFEMPDEANVIMAFKSMYQVLREGGVLILTQGTTDKQWKQKPRFISAVNTRDFSRVFVIDYLPNGVRYNILDIFHSGDKNDFKTWSINYPLVLLNDDLERLLTASGFNRLSFLGNYNSEPYDKETSDHLITIATK